jgi:hypothetical protein
VKSAVIVGGATAVAAAQVERDEFDEVSQIHRQTKKSLDASVCLCEAK